LLESRYREIVEHERVSENIFASPECAIGFVVIGLAFRFIARHSLSLVSSLPLNFNFSDKGLLSHCPPRGISHTCRPSHCLQSPAVPRTIPQSPAVTGNHSVAFYNFLHYIFFILRIGILPAAVLFSLFLLFFLVAFFISSTITRSKLMEPEVEMQLSRYHRC